MNNEITNIDFGTGNGRIHKCLKEASIDTVDDLLQFSASELIRITGVGEKSFIAISEKIRSFGFKLRDHTNSSVNKRLSTIVTSENYSYIYRRAREFNLSPDVFLKTVIERWVKNETKKERLERQNRFDSVDKAFDELIKEKE